MNRLSKYLCNLCMACCLGGITGCGEKTVVSPDALFPADGGQSLWIADRAGCELLKFSPGKQVIEKRISFPAPVNDMATDDSTLWVVCDGNNGALYELNGTDYSVRSTIQMGATPSSVLFLPSSGSLWVTQRFNNELWEISPATKQVLARIPVGREPVDMVAFANDSKLLIANNLPEASSLDFPVACRLDIVDIAARKVEKRIALPNGSTDVKSIVTDAGRQYAYVTHLLARYQLPTTQVDRGWMSTNALSVINLETAEREATVLLDTPQKGTANPWQVAVTPDNGQLIVAASGTHELLLVDRIGLHERLARAKEGEQVTPSLSGWENVQDDAGFLHGICRLVPTGGKGPRTVLAMGNHIYTANYYTGEIVSMTASATNRTSTSLGAPLTSTEEGKGDMYFHDATLCFRSWQSCASCHPNNARMDGLNWDLLNDGMGNPKNTKTLVLSHQTPPCMVTGIRKDAETAVRSGIKYILFSYTTDEVARAMDAYLKSLHPLPSPYLVNGALSDAARRGKAVFDKHCVSCHSGLYYTDRKQYKVNWTTGSEKDVRMDVPALNECWRTAPYLYDGRSYTMEEMLKVHGPKEHLPENELADLAEYVLSL